MKTLNFENKSIKLAVIFSLLCILISNSNPILPASAKASKITNEIQQSLSPRIDLDDSSSDWQVFLEGSPTWALSGATNPSIDGHSLRCAITGGNPYSNVHCYRNLPAGPNSNVFSLRLSFYYQPASSFNNAGVPSVVQGLEFTVSKWNQGTRYELALQWDNVDQGAPKWRYWDPNQSPQWVDIGLPGGVAGLMWHTLILEGEIINGNVHYRRFIFDRQEHLLDLNAAPALATGEPDRLAVAVQLDGNYAATPYELFIDNVAVFTSETLETTSDLNLVWRDEFNDLSVNVNDWNFDVGSGGWGNNELQYYTLGNNVFLQNGELVIQARKENVGGYQYTSARLNTRGKQDFKYGRIEARMKLPSGQGLWPAFWMMGKNFDLVGWPASGEVDIVEHKNADSLVYGVIHWVDHNQRYAKYGTPCDGFTNPNVDVTQYHVYDIEWDESFIIWHVDGIPYCRINIQNGINGTSEFHQPFFIVLNLAVGGQFPGAPNGTTSFPANMHVDYVRVYGDKLRAPTLISPSNGFATEDTTINFSWNSVTSGDMYEIQIDDSAEFTAPLVQSHVGELGELSYTTGLPPNRTYYWRVSAMDDFGKTGGWSTIRFLRLRSLAPTLMDPTQCETTGVLRPVFDWNDVSEARLYNVEIFLNPNFTQAFLSDSSAISSYTASNDLPPSTELYWRVRTISPGGESIWSDLQCFTTPNPPGIPALLSPGQGAVVSEYRPPFKWNPVSLPHGSQFGHYQIQVSTDKAFSTLTIDQNLAGLPTKIYNPSADLAANTQYYWRMRAFNTNDETSSWSDAHTFTTPGPVNNDRPRITKIDPTMPLPVLLTPLNKKRESTLRPVLDWTDAPGSSGYILQIATDPDFTVPTVFSVTTVDSQYVILTDLPTGDTFFWRVLTIRGGKMSGWSSIFTFEVP